jgi:hypothetical protein
VCGSEKVLIATEAQCSGNLGSWGTRYALSGAGATRLSWLVHGGAKDDDSGTEFFDLQNIIELFIKRY